VRADRMISLWKTACLSGYLLIISFSLSAQCTSAIQNITYDTLVVGSGNDNRAFTFSKFDPSIGTLVEVNISSVVSVNYGFTLKNTNSSPINFSISVGRNDDFQSAVLASPYTNAMLADVGTFVVNPNQTIAQALSPVINRYDNTININSNVVDFIGSGTIGFTYSPHTYTNHSVSPSYQYSASANDTIHFSLTYFYCTGIILSDDITKFSATKENNDAVKLIWSTVNEHQGRTYEIEKSIDGKNFSSTDSVSSSSENSSDYTYHYRTLPTEKINLWFRLKINDFSGTIKYSAIRMVDMKNTYSGNISLYPNPSDQFINIIFNQPETKNWMVDIFAANGALIQKNVFMNAATAHIDFKNKLSPGAYFMRATDQKTSKNYVLSFIVR
jgi:hypothetical protein